MSVNRKAGMFAAGRSFLLRERERKHLGLFDIFLSCNEIVLLKFISAVSLRYENEKQPSMEDT